MPWPKHVALPIPGWPSLHLGLQPLPSTSLAGANTVHPLYRWPHTTPSAPCPLGSVLALPGASPQILEPWWQQVSLRFGSSQPSVWPGRALLAKTAPFLFPSVMYTYSPFPGMSGYEKGWETLLCVEAEFGIKRSDIHHQSWHLVRCEWQVISSLWNLVSSPLNGDKHKDVTCITESTWQKHAMSSFEKRFVTVTFFLVWVPGSGDTLRVGHMQTLCWEGFLSPSFSKSLQASSVHRCIEASTIKINPKSKHILQGNHK